MQKIWAILRKRSNLLTKFKIGWCLWVFLGHHKCDTQYQTNKLQHLLSLDNFIWWKMEYQILSQMRLLNSLNLTEQLNKFQLSMSYLYTISRTKSPISRPQSAIRTVHSLHTMIFAIFFPSLFCRLTLNMVHCTTHINNRKTNEYFPYKPQPSRS